MEYILDFWLTKDTPYLALMDLLWSVYSMGWYKKDVTPVH